MEVRRTSEDWDAYRKKLNFFLIRDLLHLIISESPRPIAWILQELNIIFNNYPTVFIDYIPFEPIDKIPSFNSIETLLSKLKKDERYPIQLLIDLIIFAHDCGIDDISINKIVETNNSYLQLINKLIFTNESK